MNKIIIFKKALSEKGVALLTTVIITSIMLLVVGVASREMFSEARVVNFLDNSQVAYYSAEAGIEYALMRIRFDPDFETKLNITAADTSYTRYSLDENLIASPSGLIEENISVDKVVPKPDRRYFDLRAYYKTPSLGDNGCLKENPTTNLNCPRLLKDDTLEFTLPIPNNRYNFWWYAPKGIGADNAIVMEFSGYNKTSGQGAAITKDQLPANPDYTKYMNRGLHPGEKLPTRPQEKTFFKINPIPKDQNNQPTNDETIIRVKPWLTNLVGDQGGTGAVTLPETGNNAYVYYSLPATAGNPLIKSNITTIESIGTFGNAKRKIIARVDRSSGKVLGMFDFVIYSATDLCKPACP